MPYGWYAWGPRLLLTWVPPLLVLAIAAYGRVAAGLAARAFRSNVAVGVAALLLVIAAVPHIGFALGHHTLFPAFFAADERCPPVTPELVATEEGRDRYYSCIRYRSWEKPPVLVDAANATRSAAGAPFVLAWALALAALLVITRLRLPAAGGPARRRSDPTAP